MCEFMCNIVYGYAISFHKNMYEITCVYAYRHIRSFIHTHKCPVLKVSWYSICIVSSISLLISWMFWLSSLLLFYYSDYIVYMLYIEGCVI